jgi:hypothetical protein
MMYRTFNKEVVQFTGNQEIAYKHLKERGHLTQLEALGVYGIYRLAQRIHELRAKGVPITTTNKRDSKGRQYAEYQLEKLVSREAL